MGYANNELFAFMNSSVGDLLSIMVDYEGRFVAELEGFERRKVVQSLYMTRCLGVSQLSCCRQPFVCLHAT